MNTADKPRISWCSSSKLWYCEKTFEQIKICDAGLTPERAFRNYQRRLRRSNILPHLKGNV